MDSDVSENLSIFSQIEILQTLIVLFWGVVGLKILQKKLAIYAPIRHVSYPKCNNKISGHPFQYVMLRKDHGGLYKAPTKEERRKRKAKRREGSDQVD